MALTRDQILAISDIQVKEIKVPGWGDTIFIRQLSRGEQDAYMKRQYGKMAMKQKGKDQELGSDSIQIFGHDSWLVARGACDESGKRLFSDADEKELNKKLGEPVGYIAKQILEFSDMAKDIEEIEQAEADAVKN